MAHVFSYLPETRTGISSKIARFPRLSSYFSANHPERESDVDPLVQRPDAPLRARTNESSFRHPNYSHVRRR